MRLPTSRAVRPPLGFQPIPVLAAAVLVGVLAGPLLTVAVREALLGAVALGLLALVAPSPRTTAACLLTTATVLGALSGRPPPLPAPLPGDRTAVRGTVTAMVSGRHLVQTDRGRLLLWFGEGAPAPGTGIAALVGPARPEVLLPGGASRAAEAARWGARPAWVRDWLPLGAASPDRGTWSDGADHAGLLRALATGSRDGVPEATTALLRRTGTAHLLAISGLHVGLVAGMAAAVALAAARTLTWLVGRGPRLPRLCAGVAAVGAALAYGSRVGWPVSTQRAAVAVAMAAIALAMGRRPQPWTLLGLAALAVAIAAPGHATTAAFSLSFGAVAGILLVAPRVLRLVPPDRSRLERWTAASLATTLGATAGTLPMVAWLFQVLSPLTPLANLVAGPLVGGVAVPAALAAQTLPGPAGDLALAVGDAALTITLQALEHLDIPPWSPAVGPGGALALAACLLLRRNLPAMLAAQILVLTLRPVPVAQLQLTFLAVGQGDAAVIRWPDGRVWLVDGGPPSNRVRDWLRRQGIRRLDAVVLSHPHPDHMGGLTPVARAMPVDALWIPRRPTPDEDAFRELVLAVTGSGGDLVLADDPPPPLSGGAWARAEHPLSGWRATGRSHVNDESLVVRVGWQGRTAVFLGDVEAEAEAHLAPLLAPADVVKVAHHGSRSSSHRATMARLRPRLAVVSAGVENRYGHPHSAALARLWGVPLARTDRDGTVQVRLRRDDIRVRAWTHTGGWRTLEAPSWRPLSPWISPPAQTRNTAPATPQRPVRWHWTRWIRTLSPV